MSFLQQAPYLRTQRQFPQGTLSELASQCDQAYIDVASKVNNRVIGMYALGQQVITGEKWFLQGSDPQQTLRQIYTFSGAGSIAHGINVSTTSGFTKVSGSFTDGSNWMGAIFASTTPIAGQISFYLTSSNIVILSGAGAPSISSGYIILEWLSQI